MVVSDETQRGAHAPERLFRLHPAPRLRDAPGREPKSCRRRTRRHVARPGDSVHACPIQRQSAARIGLLDKESNRPLLHVVEKSLVSLAQERRRNLLVPTRGRHHGNQDHQRRAGETAPPRVPYPHAESSLGVWDDECPLHASHLRSFYPTRRPPRGKMFPRERNPFPSRTLLQTLRRPKHPRIPPAPFVI